MSIDRVIHLININRYDDAVKLLRNMITENPDDFQAHGFLSLCLLEQKKIEEAYLEADLAIKLCPDDPWPFYIKAKVFMQDKRFAPAEDLLKRAIELDANNADYYSNIAACKLNRDDLKGAYEFSSRAIAIDPIDEDVVDIHVFILNKMGKKDEANQLQKGALQRNPENSYTHANQGWAELHNNDPKKARIHFVEALRISPENEFAKKGLLEAIKAGNPVYRILLMWMLWLSKLSPNARWVVILGGYAIFRLADRASYAWPEYALFIKPIVYAYMTFAILTWFTTPFFNLLLFFHPIGRHILSPLEWRGSLIASIFLCFSIIGCVLFFFGFHAITLLSAFFLVMMVPHVYSTLTEENKRNKKIFLIFCSLLLISGFTFLILIYLEKRIGLKIMNYTTYAWIGFSFLQVFLTSRSE